MDCPYCKGKNNEDAMFCRHCGREMKQINMAQDKAVKGDFIISIENGLFTIKGKYYHLWEFDLNEISGEESQPVNEFLGMGYTRFISKRKCFRALGAGGAMILIKNLLTWLINTISKSHSGFYLPNWMYVIYIALIIISFGFAVSYFLSKKDIIEISFKRVRIAIPQSSMTEVEVVELRNAIMKEKEGR